MRAETGRGVSPCPAPRRPRGARSAAAALAAGLLAAVLLAGLVAAAPASAVLTRLAGGRGVSYEPARAAQLGASVFDQAFTNVDYNGGPVMPSNTNYAVYWDPAGAPGYAADYKSGLDQYFTDLAADSGGVENVDSIAAQYDDAAGQNAAYASHFAGGLIDTDPYPQSGCAAASICLTDAQLRSELTHFAAGKHLPLDLAHEYFLLTPPGVASCFEGAAMRCSPGTPHTVFCSYHSDVMSGKGVLVYADIPYLPGTTCDDGNHPSGKSADATISGGLSHEHVESITDPEPDTGWADLATGSGTGYEVGDKCRTFVQSSEYGAPLGVAPDGAKYNQVMNGHLYWLQQEWSDEGHECLQRLAPAPEAPVARFTATVTGREGHFDASASTAPGGVARYEWQFNDPTGASPPVETTTPTVSNTFPAEGRYTVALTVFAADGSPDGTARSVAVGEEFIESEPPDFGRCVARSIGEYGGSGCTRPAPGAGKYEWLGVGPKKGFTTAIVTGSTATLQTAQQTITCSGEGGAGEYAGGGAVAGVTIDLYGCAEQGAACASAGAAAGEIVIGPLDGELGVTASGLTHAKDKVGLDLFAPGRLGALAEFACAGNAVVLDGAVIAPLKTGRMASATALKYSTVLGVQKPERFEGGASQVLEAAFGAGPGERATLTLAATLTSEVAMEVNPLA
jgi:PKD repeat protein